MSTPEARLLAALSRLVACRTLDQFAIAVAEELFALIPGVSTSYNELNPTLPKAIAAIHPAPTEEWWAEFTPPFETHMHEHPVLSHATATGDTTVYTWDDLDPTGEFAATALFREFYEPCGIRSQLAFLVTDAAGVAIGIAANRDGTGFTDAERQLMAAYRDLVIPLHRLITRADRARLSVDLLGLSPRQAQVARLLQDGLTNDQIGTALGISTSTVRHHLEAVYERLGVPSRAAAVARLSALN